jgi:hypothetical protein
MSLEKAIQKLTEVISGAKLAPGTPPAPAPYTGDLSGPRKPLGPSINRFGHVGGGCSNVLRQMDEDPAAMERCCQDMSTNPYRKICYRRTSAGGTVSYSIE